MDLAAAEATGEKSVKDLEAELQAMRKRAVMESEIFKEPFRSSTPPAESTDIHVHQ